MRCYFMHPSGTDLAYLASLWLAFQGWEAGLGPRMDGGKRCVG